MNNIYVSKNFVANIMDAKIYIVTFINTLHMGIIKYTSDLHVHTIDIYSFILTWQQGLEKFSVNYK